MTSFSFDLLGLEQKVQALSRGRYITSVQKNERTLMFYGLKGFVVEVCFDSESQLLLHIKPRHGTKLQNLFLKFCLN